MTGKGQKIETSLLGSMIRLMGYSMTRVANSKKDIPRGRIRIAGGTDPYFTASFNDKNGKPFTIQIVGEDSWIKGMEVAGFSKRLAEVGCAKLGEVADSAEKAGIFLKQWMKSSYRYPRKLAKKSYVPAASSALR